VSAFGPQVQSRQFGRWRIHAIQAGGQKLDGGAMFGVVPKPLWERRIAADARNRIQLGMRCLLVEHSERLLLIDTGAGNKENEKFHDIYGVENSGRDGRTWLEDGIRQAGFSLDDVQLVINTHLHFDHAGGNTYVDAEGRIRPTFPNARYVVQHGEVEFAMTPNERTSASYFPRNWEPLREAGQLDLVDGEQTLLDGVRLLRTPGHVPHHQSVVLESGGETAVFLGDVVPTAHHLPLPWIMGYDVEPLVTLESKRRLLARARDEQWLVIFEHDAETVWARVAHDGKSFAMNPAVQ
jgi:glyoxylase-like metal-dependent hydrolase (beta-lactamase superfamily II)